MTHDIGRLTTAQTRMVTTMSELITQQNDRYEKRKNHQEEKCVHALTELRRQILKLSEGIAQLKIRTIDDIKKVWHIKSTKQYLDELIKTGFDVLDNDVKDDISLLKAEIDHKLSSDFDREITIIGQLSTIIDRLLRNGLQPARFRLIEMQNKNMGEIISRRKNQQFNEKTYKSEILYKRSLSNPYRFGGEPSWPLLDSEK